MITIFNRKELINTFSMSKQSEIRNLLRNNKIDYMIKTVNRKSPSPFSYSTRARIGTLGENTDLMYEYIIFVKKQDYEQACRLL